MHSYTDKKLQIFDLDDTLICTRKSYKDAQKSALNDLLAYEKKEEVLEELFTRLSWLCTTIGSSQKEQYFTAFLKSESIYSDKNLETLISGYNTYFWQNLKALESITIFLDHLIDQKSTLSIVSNGKVLSQKRKLDVTGLSKYFPVKNCYISEQFKSSQKKPSPHMIERVCKDFKFSPDDAVYYGNTVEDMIAGNLAGVTTIYFGRKIDGEMIKAGIANPDFQIENWREVEGF